MPSRSPSTGGKPAAHRTRRCWHRCRTLACTWTGSLQRYPTRLCLSWGTGRSFGAGSRCQHLCRPSSVRVRVWAAKQRAGRSTVNTDGRSGVTQCADLLAHTHAHGNRHLTRQPGHAPTCLARVDECGEEGWRMCRRGKRQLATRLTVAPPSRAVSSATAYGDSSMWSHM
jgi:hypothetical protein